MSAFKIFMLLSHDFDWFSYMLAKHDPYHHVSLEVGICSEKFSLLLTEYTLLLRMSAKHSWTVDSNSC